ncbi:MAG: PilZ domain-containing protein [Armatimonadetes bacterium]|nr:PilZ domain-containing protein [Armatimonadota bacterium]
MNDPNSCPGCQAALAIEDFFCPSCGCPAEFSAGKSSFIAQGPEKRESRRSRVFFKMTLHEEFVIEDLSEGGVRVRSSRELPARLRVPFNLDLGTEPFQVLGEVMWCRPVGADRHDLGIRFLEIPQTARKAIRAVLETLS